MTLTCDIPKKGNYTCYIKGLLNLQIKTYSSYFMECSRVVVKVQSLEIMRRPRVRTPSRFEIIRPS